MRCLILIAILLSMLASAQQPQPEKIAAVQKGELREARASWWGFDPEDSTAALTAAIASRVPRLIVDRMPSPWITGKTLNLVSNQEIVFEEGTELLAKAGEFKGPGDVLVCLRDIENVTLRGLGNGATLRMRKADYHTDAYQKAEWRHALSILSSRNIQVLNLKLAESGGDGIYLGVCKKGSYPTDIVIKDCVCDGNNRQGISVIAGINVLVENTKLINTKGTPPEAGIDFEPNKADEPIRNFVMRNCHSENNAGGGYVHYLPNMKTPAGPLEITFEKCFSRNDKHSAFVLHVANGEGATLPGKVVLRDCVFENCEDPVRFTGLSSTGFMTELDNVTLRNVASGKEKQSPLTLNLEVRDQETFGNMRFHNVTVYDDIDRPVLSFTNGGIGSGGMDAIEGSITRIANGKTSTTTYTSEWARKTYPPRVFRKVPQVEMANFALRPPQSDASARAAAKLSELIIRHQGNYLLSATKGEEITFSASFLQLGRYEAKDAAVTLIAPSGKSTELSPIPFKQTMSYRVVAEETGLYKLEIAAGANLSCLRSCNCPVAIESGSSAASLCTGTGDFYVNVPVGTELFSLFFWGDGQEGLHATVFSHDGAELWQQDDISGIRQFVCEGKVARRGGVFRVRIEKPTTLPTIEDYGIRITGIPPYLSPSPLHMLDYQPQSR